MTHRAPYPWGFAADGQRQHHIMLAKFYRLKVGNAARVATGVIACCHRNDGMFSRRKPFCRLFSHASGRARAGQYQTSAVAKRRRRVIHHAGQHT